MDCPNCRSTNLRYVIYESISIHELLSDGFIGHELLYDKRSHKRAGIVYKRAEIICSKCCECFEASTTVEEGRLKVHFKETFK